MGIGNIGWTEFLVILAIALIFFGPRRLPGIAQTIGKSLREFQKALNEVKAEIAQAGREADARNALTRIPPRPAESMAKPTSDPGMQESPYASELTREAEVVVEEEPNDETEADAEVTVTPKQPTPAAVAPAEEQSSPSTPEPETNSHTANDEAGTPHADSGDSNRA